MVANCLKTAVEPQKTRNSIRQSTDLSPMISRILCQDSMPRPRRDWTETTKADKKMMHIFIQKTGDSSRHLRNSMHCATLLVNSEYRWSQIWSAVRGNKKTRFEIDVCSRAKSASGVFVSKIANLASKKNREIRQVTVAFVFGKIS